MTEDNKVSKNGQTIDLFKPNSEILAKSQKSKNFTNCQKPEI